MPVLIRSDNILYTFLSKKHKKYVDYLKAIKYTSNHQLLESFVLKNIFIKALNLRGL